jgi:hypothetical protein
MSPVHISGFPFKIQQAPVLCRYQPETYRTAPSFKNKSNFGFLHVLGSWENLIFDYSPSSNAEVENEWSYTSTPQYVFMAWCLEGQLYIYFALPHWFSTFPALRTGRDEKCIQDFGRRQLKERNYSEELVVDGRIILE